MVGLEERESTERSGSRLRCDECAERGAGVERAVAKLPSGVRRTEDARERGLDVWMRRIGGGWSSRRKVRDPMMIDSSNITDNMKNERLSNVR